MTHFLDGLINSMARRRRPKTPLSCTVLPIPFDIRSMVLTRYLCMTPCTSRFILIFLAFYILEIILLNWLF